MQTSVDSNEMAHAHVEWFINAIKPLLIDHFNHGFKHGIEAAMEVAMRPRDPKFCDCDLCREIDENGK